MEDLYSEIGRLTTQLSLAQKKKLESTLTRSERSSLIDWETKEVSIKAKASLLSLNRTSLYYKPKGPSAEEIEIKHRIDRLHLDHPSFGSRKITACLRRMGHVANRKRIRRYMREMGITAVYPGPNLSRRNQQHKVYPYLLRNLTPDHPDHVWGIDITYIALRRGWMYLVAVVDWYSRYIVDWELSDSLHTGFVATALSRAFSGARPEILNSDQGCQFTSQDYIDLLKGNGVKISMDGRGRALDNAITERFWRTLKVEEVYLKEYTTPRQARQEIARFIDLYNHWRPHQSLGYSTPAEFYYEAAQGAYANRGVASKSCLDTGVHFT